MILLSALDHQPFFTSASGFMHIHIFTLFTKCLANIATSKNKWRKVLLYPNILVIINTHTSPRVLILTMCISGSYFILQTFALELHTDDSRVNTATPTKDKESVQQSSHIILLYNLLFIFISHHHIYLIFCGHKNGFVSCMVVKAICTAFHTMSGMKVARVIKSSMTTASRSRRDALLMALRPRLQVDYLVSNVRGYEMFHSRSIKLLRNSDSSWAAVMEENLRSGVLALDFLTLCTYCLCAYRC